MRIYAIALTTGREALRNKVLYSVILFACVVVGVAALFGSVSIGNQMKFVKDFGLMAIALFGVVIATTLGASMLNKELRRRTILNVLSKPVARYEFIVGKFLGLFATVAVVVTLMCAALLGILAFFEGRADLGLAVAGGMVLLELMIVVAVALCVSSAVVTPTIVGLVTAAVFVAGRCAGYLDYFTSAEQPVGLHTAARTLSIVLPHLDRFNVANQVVYGDHIAAAYVITAAIYALAYTGMLLLVGVLCFARREFT